MILAVSPQDAAGLTLLGIFIVVIVVGGVALLLGMVMVFFSAVAEGASEMSAGGLIAGFLAIAIILGLITLALGAGLLVTLLVAVGGGLVGGLVILANSN